MNKTDLRRRYKAAREALPDRAARSARAVQHLFESEGVVGALGAFAPIGAEADPGGARAERLAHPRIEGDELSLRWSSRDQLVPTGPWSIPEPSAEAPRAQGLDLVLVPGLVFDGHGARLGYGRGYYDRLIRRLRAGGEATRFLGFGFEMQLSEGPLPQHAGDERLDGYLCEAGLVWFQA